MVTIALFDFIMHIVIIISGVDGAFGFVDVADTECFVVGDSDVVYDGRASGFFKL